MAHMGGRRPARGVRGYASIHHVACLRVYANNRASKCYRRTGGWDAGRTGDDTATVMAAAAAAAVTPYMGGGALARRHESGLGCIAGRSGRTGLRDGTDIHPGARLPLRGSRAGRTSGGDRRPGSGCRGGAECQNGRSRQGGTGAGKAGITGSRPGRGGQWRTGAGGGSPAGGGQARGAAQTPAVCQELHQSGGARSGRGRIPGGQGAGECAVGADGGGTQPGRIFRAQGAVRWCGVCAECRAGRHGHAGQAPHDPV